MNGRVIMITGGASGIGREAAIALASDGAVVAVADRSAAGATAVINQIRAAGGSGTSISFDVRDQAATEWAIASVEEELGPIDGLITSAGISKPAPATALTAQDWEAVLGVNLTGTFFSCQAVGRRMVARQRGSIVTVGSILSTGAQAGRAHYSASKGGIVALTRDLAIEWGHAGVRVNCVGPNATETPMVRNGIPPRFVSEVMEDRTPLGRLCTPSEVADVCRFLLSDLSRYMTGAFVPVDGGASSGYFTRRHGRDLSSQALLFAGVYSE